MVLYSNTSMHWPGLVDNVDYYTGVLDKILQENFLRFLFYYSDILYDGQKMIELSVHLS